MGWGVCTVSGAVLRVMRPLLGVRFSALGPQVHTLGLLDGAWILPSRVYRA